MHRPARILIYSQDSYGLGHLRRASNLANALVRADRDLSVLLVVDSPVAPFFDLSDHIDFVKLPTMVKVAAGVFKPGRLLASSSLIKTIRSKILRDLFRWFDPDLILVDHMPGGANGELIPALRIARSVKRGAKVALGVRDIIDDPKVTCAVWDREGCYETLKRYYDAVLIYGLPEIFPTAERYRIGEVMNGGVRYCGYVCNMGPVKSPALVRSRIGVGPEPLVAVMAGGGADAQTLMQTYLEALPLITATVRAATLMVTGPFMPEAARRALRDRGNDLGVRVETAVGDSLAYVNAADLVVSMAGYNTLSEILRFRKPAIVVPRAGPSAEQRMRSTLFAERGLVSYVSPEDLSPTRLAHAIVRALMTRASHNPESVPALGVTTATHALLQLLSNGTSRKARAERRSAARVTEPAPVRVKRGPAQLRAAGQAR
jgi:predicted glycosyltransferase